MRYLLNIVLLAGIAQARLNVSSTQQSVDFSIDEVALLNRHFLDYLVAYDDSQVVPDQDRRCIASLKQLSAAYDRRERHGLEWFDSWGKIPSGLYYANGNAFGNYEQCRRFSWNDVRGQHCTFVALLPNPELPMFQSGLCVPQFCTEGFVGQVYGGYLESKGASVVPMFGEGQMCNKDRDVVFSGGVVTAIVIFSILAGLALASTLYEVVQIIRNQTVIALYSSFSLYKNVRGIFHTTPRITDPEKQLSVIECVNGVRALSMLWIIIVHIHESIIHVPIENAPGRMDYMGTFGSSILFTSGYLAVDTFLALSGMLVAFNILNELDKNGKINPLKMYLHRYIRITGPYAALILFGVSFAKYMGEGLLWNPIMEHHEASCSKYWWSALLYIQNYVNPTNMCFGWTWYLSVDMQLYIIGPALIYPLWRWGKRVLFAIGGLAVLSMLCVLTTFLINEFRFNFNTPNAGDRAVLTYYPTHARMSVWLLGAIFGYVLHVKKTKGINLPDRLYAFGWVTCFAILGVIMYANFELIRTPYEEFSHVIDAFYEAFGRSFFAVCVLWVIIACVNGKAGVINDFLSSSLWQPLSKLSYTAYLLHVLLLMMASVISVKTDLHFSVIDLFYRIWGAFGLSLSVSVFWSALFEIPFVTLDRILLR
ncbi:conserved hypothetical protein [Culex quinquefasciatus]|uniref:Nose resistant-to-fluoxetine protein N-terminal domain-containing protein n=1 Tax=Culex quinquefasciatus TaxID=7176 RepID=B0WMA6_CULQU|nr:conserved hypothetical protein [Culex quinquefasciatus]|eukprot:XP_001849840.1 conserved hypothetical protein [Culex quinquefasciatus]